MASVVTVISAVGTARSRYAKRQAEILPRVVVCGAIALVSMTTTACVTSSTTIRETVREQRTIDPDALDPFQAEVRIWDEIEVVRREGPAATFGKARVGQLSGSVIVFSPWSDRVLDTFPLEEVLRVEVSSSKTRSP